MNNETIFSGWWLSHPSEKYEFVSWDDDIPNMMGNIKAMFRTTNQYIYIYIYIYVYIYIIDIHQTTTQWRPHVLHQGWFLQETLHGTWPWQGQWHGHLDLSFGHVVLRSKTDDFLEFFFFLFHVFLKIQNLFMVFRMFFNRLDSKTTHLQLFETTAAPLSMTSESPSWCSPSQKLPKGPPRSLTEGFLVARPRRSFPGAQWRIWKPVVYYRYGHKH